MENEYLNSIRKQFEYCKTLGDKTFGQVEDAGLFWQYGEASNSIAIIVNHLWGNMLSRWTDFLTADGEKPWRERDLEFEPVIDTREALLAKWEEGWACLFGALDSVNEADIESTVYIRNQAHSVVEALNRQLSHYSYHVGQIVLLGKMVRGGQWKSLSIPKGGSTAFNAAKFAKGKHGGHYTDDLE